MTVQPTKDPYAFLVRLVDWDVCQPNSITGVGSRSELLYRLTFPPDWEAPVVEYVHTEFFHRATVHEPWENKGTVPEGARPTLELLGRWTVLNTVNKFIGWHVRFSS